MNIGGVYKIINKINNKYYVGSTSNFKKRWNQHIKLLNRNKHKNDYLQNAWNKYGKNAFEFIVVEYTDVNLIKIIEQRYLDITKTEKEKCYNLNYKANGGELSEYSKQKIKLSKLEYWEDVEKRKLQSEKLKIATSSQSARFERSIRAKKYFSLEENRKHQSNLRKNYLSVPENKEKIKKQNTGLNNPMSDKQKYNFYNKKTGSKEYCTRYEIRTNPKYLDEKLSQSGIAQLCLGKFISYKNWIIIK